MLDAVRAAEAFAPAGLDGVKTKVGLWGYSGGAQATAWAAELHPTYAPELNVVGAAHGAAPYVLRKTIAKLDGSPYMGIVLAAVVGIGRAYPEMRLDEVLNERGKEMQARDRRPVHRGVRRRVPGRAARRLHQGARTRRTSRRSARSSTRTTSATGPRRRRPTSTSRPRTSSSPSRAPTRSWRTTAAAA